MAHSDLIELHKITQSPIFYPAGKSILSHWRGKGFLLFLKAVSDGQENSYFYLSYLLDSEYRY